MIIIIIQNDVILLVNLLLCSRTLVKNSLVFSLPSRFFLLHLMNWKVKGKTCFWLSSCGARHWKGGGLFCVVCMVTCWIQNEAPSTEVILNNFMVVVILWFCRVSFYFVRNNVQVCGETDYTFSNQIGLKGRAASFLPYLLFAKASQ